MEESGVTVLAAGFKGLVFLDGLVARGMRPDRIISYDEKDDASEAFLKLAQRAAFLGSAFEESRRPALAAGEMALVVGWQYLLDAPAAEIVVFHDSLLPRYRGFAPTVTALLNGDGEIGVTALRPEAGVDSGAIYAQKSFAVSYPAKIAAILERQSNLMADLAVDLLVAFRSGALSATPQDEAAATLSVWRDADDYWIDWKSDADAIRRFVDAIGHPYPGARSYCGETPLIIEECSKVDLPPFEILQPGKVWALDQGRPIVICGGGAVRIEGARTFDGRPFVFDRLRVRFSTSPRAEHPVPAEETTGEQGWNRRSRDSVQSHS
jgi:hypothetical protein